MDESVRKGNRAEAFEHYRVLLFSIAYRMTGSAGDAEDLVQETYLRYQASQSEEIVSLKAYLTTILTHLALNYLKSARVVREQYLGIWLPEPILTSEDGGVPQAALEQQEELSLAFLRLLETLSPPERAVFLLHEIFDYPFHDIGAILSKSPATCRRSFIEPGWRCRTSARGSSRSRSAGASFCSVFFRPARSATWPLSLTFWLRMPSPGRMGAGKYGRHYDPSEGGVRWHVIGLGWHGKIGISLSFGWRRSMDNWRWSHGKERPSSR